STLFPYTTLFRSHADGGFDGPAEVALQLLERAHCVGENLRGDLDLHLHDVEVLLARQENLVVRQGAFHLQKGSLDLRRIDVDPADDKHVVGAAPDALDAPERATALAGFRSKGGNITRAIPDHRHCLL